MLFLRPFETSICLFLSRLIVPVVAKHFVIRTVYDDMLEPYIRSLVV